MTVVQPLRAFCLVLVVLATVIGVSLFVRGCMRIVTTVRIGRPVPAGRLRPVGRRLATLATEVLGHTGFRGRPAVRAAHWAVMVSFPVLLLTLVAGYGQVVDPRYVLPLVGHLAPWEWITEAFAWAGLVGIVALVAVRLRTQPRHPGHGRADRVRATGSAEPAADPGRRRSRFFGSDATAAYVVEATVGLVVLAVLVLRGLEYALAAQAGDPVASTWHFPLTAWFGAAWASASTAVLEDAVVVCATVKILVSMAWFVVVGLQPTMGVAWHRFLAIVNVYARREPDGAPALGPLGPLVLDGRPVDLTAPEDLPEDVRLGAGAVEDLSWKALLDASTCTECGRCQEQCPAWVTGKPLSPKLVMASLRDHAAATAPYLRAGDTSHAGIDLVSSGVIDPDVLWSCTTCGACVQQCPVDIEHVDTLLDIRRYQVLMESSFPAELGATFTKIERQGNPWGLPARTRRDWMTGLDVEVPVIGQDVDSADGLDYVLWVGCAGAYEERAQRTTRAVLELLHTAGLTVGVLAGETCTGDPARRAGNELLFQMLASTNVATLDEARVQRIVVTCAHCFNTLAREYPQLGGRYEVIHHTELLDRLVAEGRLTPLPTDDVRHVTYHDPCYLGRHNGVYAPPRDLLAAIPGVELAEMPRSGETSFCCGGGGARMWMAETIGTRISEDRAAEAIATGADTIATACPYCTVMLSDGAAAVGHPQVGAPQVGVPQVGVPEVADIAVLLLDAVRGTSPAAR